MKHLILVFIGGGSGSILRFFLSKWLNTSSWPIGTFVSNILGSLIIGIILGYALKNNTFSSQSTLLIATGFCGGFTTFSTFAYENLNFLKNGEYLNLGLYSIGSFTISLIAVFLGMYLLKSI